MPLNTLHDIDPFQRFRELYQELSGDVTLWVAENAWIRFAAQEAAMCPDSAASTAEAIRAVAAELQAHARWYEALSSPFNQLVAATLVQTGDTVPAFTEEMASAQALFRKHGLHGAGIYEVLAILTLRVVGGRPVGEAVVERLQRIYQSLKRHHWWLSGDEDLPICALQTTCSGSPEEIAGVADGIYHELLERRHPKGRPLLTAANLLPLAGLPALEISARFQSLMNSFHATYGSVWEDELDASSLLGLLDHQPQVIVERFGDIFGKLSNLSPQMAGEVNFTIACDLAFLDLARFDRAMRPLQGATGEAAMQRLFRTQRAAALALVKMPTVPISPVGGMMWP
jgi:hypothetical protein